MADSFNQYRKQPGRLQSGISRLGLALVSLPWLVLFLIWLLWSAYQP